MSALDGATAGLVAWLAVVPALTAQAVDGRWEVRFAQAVRVTEDGSVEIQRWGEAELLLSASGDSVFGTWTAHVAENVTWSVSGVVQGDLIHLRASESDSDDPELRQVEEILWEATISNDRLEGRMAYRFRGARRPAPWRPLSGRHVGGGGPSPT